MIKREVAAFPRYSLNFEATGAREAEENEGEDFGREGGGIRVTRGGDCGRGGGGLGSPYFALMTLPFLGCNKSESGAGEVELRCQASSKSVAGGLLENTKLSTQTFLSTNLYCQSGLMGSCKHII